MNCPKCGSHVDEGKNYCFMCGTKLGNNDFSSPGRIDDNPSLNSEYYRKKEEYKNRLSNYRDVKIERVENDKRDLFDLYSEFKIFFKLGFFLLILALGLFISYRIAVKNNKEEKLKPVILNLYYKVDDKLTMASKSDTAALYNISEGSGTTCSISVAADTSTSGDYVKNKFDEYKNVYIGNIRYDENFNVISSSTIPLFTENTISVNGTMWNYLYVFFKGNNKDSKYTFLKNRHLVVGYKESFYQIALVNNENDFQCNLYLDSFVRSLQFIS